MDLSCVLGRFTYTDTDNDGRGDGLVAKRSISYHTSQSKIEKLGEALGKKLENKFVHEIIRTWQCRKEIKERGESESSGAMKIVKCRRKARWEKLFLMYSHINVLKEDWNIYTYRLEWWRPLGRDKKKTKYIYGTVKLVEWATVLEIMFTFP